MNDRIVLTDDILVRALQQRMAHSPAPHLLERIVAGASVTAQDRTPRRWLFGRRAGFGAPARPRWTSLPGLAGAAVAVVVAVLLVLVIRPVLPPGATPTPLPSPSPAVTPVAVEVGTHAGLRLALGSDVAPIDLIFADGSIWTANIRANDIRRFDPATLTEVARIRVPVGQGPAWFTATDGALWVSNQLGGGLDHIDTTTNQFTEIVGSAATCGAPVQAFDSIWQSACDFNVFMRIDPVTREVETIPAENHGFLVLAGGRLVTGDPEGGGYAVLDPETYTFESLRFTVEGAGQLLGSEGESLWIATDGGVLRVDPDSGATLATFPHSSALSVTFSGGQAWLAVPFVGVVQIDLATNEVVQTIPVNVSFPAVAREAAGAIWVTDFDNSSLWRIQP